MEIYDSWNQLYKTPFGAVPSGDAIRFQILPQAGLVQSARLLVSRDSGERFSVDMQKTGRRDGFESYSCVYSLFKPGLFWYHFELETESGNKYLVRSHQGLGTVQDLPGNDWQLTVYRQDFQTPDWPKGGIMYQVFPDRFCRDGEWPEGLPEGRYLRDDWGGIPEFRDDDGGRYFSNTYFGGNIKGILSKLPYLQSLGVNILYLNPIFEAHSNHRYNTADYHRIDPLLGTEEDFRRLCSAAGRMGIRIVLDGVFSHTGDDSVYFNKYGRYPQEGAFQSKQSPYYHWYDFRNWPDEYRCWWNFTTLPEVNETQESYLSFITGKDGVLEHWMKDGISGWRLDVADELPSEFLDRLRESVKSCDPDSLIIGEVWEDASQKISYGERRRYLNGGELDSVMNYPFRNGILDFLKGGSAEDFNTVVMSILENYPKPAVDVLMNLLGTHDTERLITALAGESGAGRDRRWKSSQTLNAQQRERGKRLAAMAAAIQFFLPGIPCIYYGDEAGMEGYEDPFNRKCFPWEREDPELLSVCRRLSRIRSACPALKTGGFQCVEAMDGFYAFLRNDGQNAILCAVNRTDKPKTVAARNLFESYVDLTANPADCKDKWAIPEYGFKLYGKGTWVNNL